MRRFLANLTLATALLAGATPYVFASEPFGDGHDDATVLEGSALTRFRDPAGGFEPLDLGRATALTLDGGATRAVLEAPPIEAPVPFLRLGFMWDAHEPPGTAAVLEARVSGDGYFWGPWQQVPVVWQEGEAHNGFLDVQGAPATHVQLRVRLRGTEHASPSLTYLFVEYLSSVEREGGMPFDSRLHKGRTKGGPVNPRSAWGARDPVCVSFHTPEKITVHHTVTPTVDTLTPEQRLRQIQDYHIDVRGWCDIGYHYLVSRDARLWQGREELWLGAHVGGYNTNNVGISFMGTHTTDPITDSQFSSTVTLMVWLRDTYGVPATSAAVKGHRDYLATECPGDALYARVPDLIAAMAGGGMPGCAAVEAAPCGSKALKSLAIAGAIAALALPVALRRRPV